jgi:hypothetical protein
MQSNPELSVSTAGSSVNGTLAMICAMGSYRIKSRQPSCNCGKASFALVTNKYMQRTNACRK